jgi:chromosome partitioning protein
MKVIAVYSIKGGVGKTTAAVNLAWEASQNFRVLLWDLDPQGATTFLLEVKPKVKGGVDSLMRGKTAMHDAIRSTAYENLEVLPADDSYRALDLVFDAAKKSTQQIEKALDTVIDDYDVVILDCPPGASLVAENAMRASDAIVVPLVPSPLSLRSLEQVKKIVAESERPAPIIGFLSMVDRRKGVHREAVESLHSQHKEVTDIVVPSTVIVERMGTERAPVASYAPHAEAALAYGELWKRLQGVVKAKQAKRKH